MTQEQAEVIRLAMLAEEELRRAVYGLCDLLEVGDPGPWLREFCAKAAREACDKQLVAMREVNKLREPDQG